LDEDDDLDETAEEEAVFGGDGVRALTSATFRLSEDSFEDIAEVETAVAADASIDAAEGTDEEVEDDAVPFLRTRVSFAEGGDEDLDRGNTSTTFNAEEEEEEDEIAEERDAALDTGVIEDIQCVVHKSIDKFLLR
jgi:hypothetical protein